jgi:hypothetical protein
MSTQMSEKPSRRVWVQNVAVGEMVLRARLEALAARRLAAPDPEADAIEDGVRALLDKASAAAHRVDPQPRRLPNWWRGTLYEAGFQHLHAAEAEIVRLYNPDELRAELPEALARVEQGLQRDDPRRAEAQRLATSTTPPDAAAVSRLIEMGYSAADQQHSRVRSFRNVVLIAAAVITLFLALLTAYVSTHPGSLPLCFRTAAVAADTAQPTVGQVQLVCPTSESVEGQGVGPQGRDVLVVVLLGLMGGALASAISLRNVKGTSTPYDVPLSLAALKVPTGALTAIAALIAIRGDFVPGLSSLDSPEQILAYALVFGYAQQLLTGLVDRQGQSILSSVPSKDAAGDRPGTVLGNGLPPVADGGVAADVDADSDDDVGADDGDDRADDDESPDADADESDIPDPEPRDVPDGELVDDTGTLEVLPDDDDDDDEADDEADDEDPNALTGTTPITAEPGGVR